MIRTAASQANDPAAAAAELKQQLGAVEDGLLLFFASSSYDPAAIAEAVHGLAGQGAASVGCTTAGELTTGKMLKGGVVAMALPAAVTGPVYAGLIEGVGDRAAIDVALDGLQERLGEPLSGLAHDRWLGFIVTDGLSLGEERVMEAIGARTNAPFVGGSAGDDAAFAATHVFCNGRAVGDAAAYALCRPAAAFQVIKTQSFDVLAPELTVTKADETTRTVHAFNGKPAAQAYAEALGVAVDELPDRFMSNPLGLMVDGGEPFVRSPMQLDGDAVVFYCNIAEGMKLRLLSSRDIVADTRRDLAAALPDPGKVGGLINFHCILRTLELEAKDQTGAYGQVFDPYPTVGFSTYGESYIGHINQTSTIVAFLAD